MLHNALRGVKVVDLSRILAGPWCTQNLSDLGAQVIKVEHPERGDDTPRLGPRPARADGGASMSAYFMACNRGKQSVAIDFSTETGAARVRELVADATSWSRTTRPAACANTGWTMTRSRASIRASSTLHHRLRPDRPLRQPSGIRLRVPGHGRADELYRAARRHARRGPLAHRRRGGGPDDRHVRHVGGAGGPAPARPDRTRHAVGHLPAGRGGGAEREPGRQLPGVGRGAQAQRQRPSQLRAVRGLRLRRRPPHPGHRQRRPVRALQRRGRAPGMGGRRALRNQ